MDVHRKFGTVNRQTVVAQHLLVERHHLLPSEPRLEQFDSRSRQEEVAIRCRARSSEDWRALITVTLFSGPDGSGPARVVAGALLVRMASVPAPGNKSASV